MCSFLKHFKATHEINFVKDEEKKSTHKDSVDEIFNIYHLERKKKKLYKIDFLNNSVHIAMEIDTGASISVINYDTYLKLSCK